MFSVSSLAVFATVTLSQLAKVAAHGGVLAYSNAGNWYQGWAPYNTPVGQTTIERPWSTYNPITDATDAQLGCNDNGTAGALQLTATVEAGSSITAYWNQVWPHAYGPMLVYLAQCPGDSCTPVSSNDLQWFKIDQCGLINGTVYDGVWGDGVMIVQNSSWTTVIPKEVPTGNYLIRFETIALHSLPAQFYPECAQISITNGGSLAPSSSELVSFPGAYSNTDPGLTVDIYGTAAETMTTYPIPGPALYSGATPLCPASGWSSSPVSSAPASSAPASTASSPTSSHAPVSTQPSQPSQTPTGGTAAEYGQCGGEGWTGPTVCASPYTCTYTNAYYSQCL